MENIKMVLGEIGWGWVSGLDWPSSGQEQVEGSCECCNEPSDFINGGKLSSGFTAGVFSRVTLIVSASLQNKKGIRNEVIVAYLTI
jgi:hypothetical protein